MDRRAAEDVDEDRGQRAWPRNGSEAIDDNTEDARWKDAEVEQQDRRFRKTSYSAKEDGCQKVDLKLSETDSVCSRVELTSEKWPSPYRTSKGTL